MDIVMVVLVYSACFDTTRPELLDMEAEMPSTSLGQARGSALTTTCILILSDNMVELGGTVE